MVGAGTPGSDGKPVESASISARRPFAAFLCLTSGAILLLVHVLVERQLPRGPGEFAYRDHSLSPLPFAAMRGFTFEQLALHALRGVVLTPALLLLTWGVVRWLRHPPREPLLTRRITTATIVLGLALAASALLGLLQGRAFVDDELTYAEQARLLAAGQLADRSVPAWGPEPFTIYTRHGATGKYLFGEPLVQALGVPLGLPPLPHLALLALVLVLWPRVVRRDAGVAVGRWAVVLVALSPMVIFTTASGLSHPTTLACVVVAGWGWQRCRDRGDWVGGATVGAALGFCCAVRPQVALPAGLVIGGAALVALARRRRWAGIAALAAAGSFWIALVLGYDQFITGSPWKLPWDLYHPREFYGFRQVLDGFPYVHTPLAGLANLALTVVRFNGWWLGWPLSLGLVALWWIVGRPKQGLWLWAGVGAAIVAFHFGYYSPGVSDTGPVYYYELLLPASLLGGHALAAGARRWPSVVAAGVVVHMLFGTGTFLTEQWGRLGRLTSVVHRPVEELLATIKSPALVLHERPPVEWVQAAWLSSFPLRSRDPRSPIVTYPRGSEAERSALRQIFRDRECWYLRFDPERMSPELRRCEEAEALLARPLPTAGPELIYQATARRLGLLPPISPAAGSPLQ